MDQQQWQARRKECGIPENQRLTSKADTFWTFGEGHRRPACVRRWIPWFGWVGFVALSRSQHGRDGRAPFFCREKSNFKETLVLGPTPEMNE